MSVPGSRPTQAYDAVMAARYDGDFAAIFGPPGRGDAELHGDFDLSPIDDRARQLVVIARRPR